MSTTTAETMHMGRKIEGIRELRGIKQETLASALGISQQAVSKMENSPEIDDDKLKKVAQALDVSVEAIKNFNEESAINYFNTFNDSSGSGSCSNYSTFNFNSPEDYLKLIEENKNLYERLLAAEREKNILLQKLVDSKV